MSEEVEAKPAAAEDNKDDKDNKDDDEHKKVKIDIDTAGVLDSDDEESDVFKPLPYVFVLKDPYGNTLNLTSEKAQNTSVICPPYYTLLDHLIAVLWIFYSGKGIERLSPSHFHWALKFLEGTKNRRNEYSPDIGIVIEHIQQAIMDLTAQLNENEVLKRYDELNSTTLPPKKGDDDEDKDFQAFVKGIDGENELSHRNSLGSRIPSLILTDMSNDMCFEEIQDLVNMSSYIHEDEEAEDKAQKKDGEVHDSTASPEIMQWRTGKIQKAIEQLELIKNIDETLQQLKCDMNPEISMKLKELMDKEP